MSEQEMVATTVAAGAGSSEFKMGKYAIIGAICACVIAIGPVVTGLVSSNSIMYGIVACVIAVAGVLGPLFKANKYGEQRTNLKLAAMKNANELVLVNARPSAKAPIVGPDGTGLVSGVSGR